MINLKIIKQNKATNLHQHICGTILVLIIHTIMLLYNYM